jgi:hypothetical protein
MLCLHDGIATAIHGVGVGVTRSQTATGEVKIFTVFKFTCRFVVTNAHTLTLHYFHVYCYCPDDENSRSWSENKVPQRNIMSF